jgi:hypothetical protein
VPFFLGIGAAAPITFKMAPSFDFVDWWNKEQHRGGTPVVVKMENPNYSMLEIESPKTGFEGAKDKGKNAKQLTWVLLLKAHRAAGCVAWVALGLWTVLAAIKKRLILGQGLADPNTERPRKGRLFKAITGFLVFAIFMLCVEVGAHMMGWHFVGPHWPPAFGVRNLPHAIYVGWIYFRAQYIAPPLQFLINFCIYLFLLQSADRILLCLGCLWIKWKNIKPIPVNSSLESDDLEQPDKGYPMVLLQIPMCNEREVHTYIHTYIWFPSLLFCLHCAGGSSICAHSWPFFSPCTHPPAACFERIQGMEGVFWH